MEKLEMIEKRNSLVDQLEEMKNKIQIEERKFDENEVSEFENIEIEIRKIDDQLKERERENKIIAQRSEQKNNVIKMTENFSLFKLIENNLNERNYEFQIPMVENRALSAGTAGAGAEMVPTEKMDLLTPLKYNSAFIKAGATFISNATSNFSYPVYAGTTAQFLGENATITDGSGAVTSIDFSPKRISASIAVSKTLLKQSNSNLEAKLLEDLSNQFAKGIDAVIGGSGAVSTTSPGGIFNGVTTTTEATVTYKTITDMEAALQNVDVYATDYKFVANPSAVSVLKSKNINTGKQVAEGNLVDGIEVVTGSQILNKGIVLGKWSDLMIVNFGDIDVVLDPYTGAKTNQIIITATLNLDAKVLRSTSFSKLVIA